MNLENELFTWLGTNVPLATGGIYNTVAKQDVVAPYLIFQKLNRIPGYSHDGPSGFDPCRVQFTACASTMATALSITTQLETALSGFRGSMAALEVGSAFIELETSSYDLDIQLYSSIVDYIITIQN